MKRISEEQAVNAQAKAFIKTLPDCRCEELNARVKELEEFVNGELMNYLRDMASFECFCCNLSQLSEELIIKIQKLRTPQKSKEEMCKCGIEQLQDYYHNNNKCAVCGKPIKED